MRDFRKGHRREFGFESLESRQMLAGDVQATVAFGNLTLTGDNATNAVEIRGTGVAGEVAVRPLFKAGQTTLQGSTDEIVFSGVTGNVKYLGNLGDDDTIVHDLSVGGDLRIEIPEGTSTVRIGAWVAYGQPGTGDVNVGGTLSVRAWDSAGPDGADYVFLGRTWVSGKIEVYTGGGNDTLEVYNARAGIVEFFTGDDSDVINIAYLQQTNSSVSVKIYGDDSSQSAPGHDLVSIITTSAVAKMVVDGGQGYNTLALNANNFGNELTLIVGGYNNNSITLTNSYVAGRCYFFGSYGNDAITITGNTISGKLGVYPSQGNDSATITANLLTQVEVIMEYGDDAVYFRNNLCYDYVQLWGGSGSDLLGVSGNVFHNGSLWLTFEVITT
jgi:hypothetical protein